MYKLLITVYALATVTILKIDQDFPYSSLPLLFLPRIQINYLFTSKQPCLHAFRWRKSWINFSHADTSWNRLHQLYISYVHSPWIWASASTRATIVFYQLILGCTIIRQYSLYLFTLVWHQLTPFLTLFVYHVVWLQHAHPLHEYGIHHQPTQFTCYAISGISSHTLSHNVALVYTPMLLVY